MQKNFFLFIAISILMGCNNFEKEAIDYMLISGVVKNAPDHMILAIGKKHQIIVKEGTYSDTLRLAKNQEVFMYLQSNLMKSVTFYYKPGLDLNVSFDHNNFWESIEISGSGKKYIDFIDSVEQLNPTDDALEQLRALPEEDFVNALKEQFQKQGIL